MGIQWTEEQRKVADIILKHRREEGSGYDMRGVQGELPNVPKSFISKVSKALRENNWEIPEVQTPGKSPRPSVRIQVEQPAPTVIYIRGKKVDLYEEHLRNAHYLWEEMESKIKLGGTFSEAIEDGVAELYRHLVLEIPKAPKETEEVPA